MKQKFEGIWAISRTIIRKNPIEQYNCEGFAAWSQDQENENRLLYHEKVKVAQVGAQSSNNTQKKYQYEFDPGRPNHFIKYYDRKPCKYTFEGERASGEYKCGQDTYRGTFAFKDEDHFNLTYQVVGPDKDYLIFTEYSRCNDQDIKAMGLVINDGEIE